MSNPLISNTLHGSEDDPHLYDNIFPNPSSDVDTDPSLKEEEMTEAHETGGAGPATTPMAGVVTGASLPAPLADMSFDGNPADLKRLITHVRIRVIGNDAALNTDARRSAFVASHFRGAALDWLGAQLETDPDALDDFDAFIKAVSAAFGYSGNAAIAVARQELETLKQSEDLLLFLTRFEALTATIGLVSDTTRVTLVMPKLSPYYAEAIRKNGTIFTRWSTLRATLINLDAMRVESGKKDPEKKRRRAKCGKCGKRGHTAAECRSGN